MNMLFEKNDRILFIGDSIGDYDRYRPVGDSADGWGTSYVSDVASMLQAAYPAYRMRIMNVCTSGHQSRDLENRWDEDVMNNRPDWVCMMIGINDVWRQYDCPDRPELWYGIEDYEAALCRMIEKTLPKVKGMVLMTPYFLEQNKEDEMRKTMDAYGAVVKKLGEKYGILTIDTQKMWDDFFTEGGLHPHAICWDCIHPNIIGRKVLCRTFLKAVGYEW
ncbi:MAG: SGNH/GDSL hydrolase family protein [Clostridia bacterium]|jgi:lysophospholipase L1-like esterase|nr:SGNH/GDSL hydrolase family protein [Clostridia bacterium]